MADGYGPRIRQLREAAGLTREQLAERTGFSLAGLIKWELGQREPSLSNAVKLANALGVDCRAFSEPLTSPVPPRGRGRPAKAEAPPEKPAKGRGKK